MLSGRFSTGLICLRVPVLLLVWSILATGCKEPDPSERLKPLVENYVHAWNTGDFNGLDEIVSPEFELRMTPRFDAVRSLDSKKNDHSAGNGIFGLETTLYGL